MYEPVNEVGNFCKVLFNYTKNEDNQLDLKKGEIILIVDKIIAGYGWWAGEKVLENGKRIRGIFPGNYVRELSPDEARDHEKCLQLSRDSKPTLQVDNKYSSAVSYCKVMFNYTKNKDDELDLKKGEIILIVDKVFAGHGWWRGEKTLENGKRIRGVFPGNYVVELTPNEARDHDKSLQLSPAPSAWDSKPTLQVDGKYSSEKEELKNILRVAKHQIAEGDGDSAIERVEDFLSKESRSAMDVKNMADDLKGKGHYFHAMILYKISHDLHKKHDRFSRNGELVKGLIQNMYSAVYLFVASGGLFRKIAVNFGVNCFEEMKEELHTVTNTSPEKRARFEAYRLSCMADMHLIIDEFEESIQFSEQGVNIMVEQFGEKASNYKLYGDLLDMLAAAYYESGQYSYAERRYVMSINVKENALYYKNEDERHKDMAITKRKLEETRLLKKRK